MFVPKLSPNFEKYRTAINMAFLKQAVDKYLQENMNSFSVSNFSYSKLFNSIHFINDRIFETKQIPLFPHVCLCQSLRES
jgi:hypothetical protein